MRSPRASRDGSTAVAGGEVEGPAFDTNTLTRPTTRKLVCCWMEQAGLPTVILPQVWTELTRMPRLTNTRVAVVESWRRIARMDDPPFLWATLDDEQHQLANEVIECFTQACFPNADPDTFDTHGDAVIIAEAVAVGTEALVTSDTRSIDHYEVNGVLAQAFGSNVEFVTTLDSALCRAHPCGQASEKMLLLALAAIAPPQGVPWPVDEAHDDLQRMRQALVGARLLDVSSRLESRWEQSRDLERLLEQAQDLAANSRALHVERVRSGWHREHEASHPKAV